MPRLPIPGADDGVWGDILNDYLSVEHNADGSLKAKSADNTYTGKTVFKSATEGTDVFSVRDAEDTPVLNIDTQTRAVGMGVTAPARQLHLVGGTSNGLRIDRSGSPHIELVRTDADLNKQRWRLQMGTIAGDTVFQIYATDDAGGGRTTIPPFNIDGATGNLGIGTSNPATKLHVESADWGQLTLKASDATADGHVSVDFNGRNAANTAGVTPLQIFTSDSMGAQLWSFGAGTVFMSANRVAINLGGKPSSTSANFTVRGIGDGTYPAQQIYVANATQVPLQIKGAASQTADLQQWQNSAGTVLTQITNDGTLRTPSIAALASGKAYMNTDSGTSALGVYTNGSGNMGLFVRASASQSVDIMQWQNSAGTRMLAIGPDGKIKAQNSSGQVRNVLHASGWGYSPSTYHSVVIGSDGSDSTTATTISFGYDPSANTDGSFAGDGREMLFRNNAVFQQPNAANTGWHKPFVMNDGRIGLGNRVTGPPSTAAVTLVPLATGETGLLVKGMASQTGDLQQWQDSTGLVAASIASNGRLTVRTPTTTTQLTLESTANANNATHFRTVYDSWFGLTSFFISPHGYDDFIMLTGFKRTGIGFGSAGIAVTGSGSSSPIAARLHVVGATAADPTMITQGATSQTADLQQWQDSAGNTLSRITSVGAYSGPTVFRGCKLKRTGADMISGSSGTLQLLYDAEDFDSDGYHSTALNTDRVTIPAGLGGKYRFHAAIAFNNPNTINYRRLAFYINGVLTNEHYELHNPAAVKTWMILDAVLNLSAGDYVTVAFYQNCTLDITLLSTHFVLDAEYLGA